MRADLETLEAALGHCFSDRKLLERALTHKSRVYEKNLQNVLDDNEQLEFLGDSILGFVVSELLVSEHPEYPEGRLSKLRAHLVSASHLYEVARAINLGEYLLLGRGEELSGGREKPALLANAVEALIAALYIDGGIEAARMFIRRQVVGDFQPPEQAGEITGSDRFEHVFEDVALDRFLGVFELVVAREDHNDDLGVMLRSVRGNAQTVHSGHGDIRHDHVRMQRLDRLNRLLPVLARLEELEIEAGPVDLASETTADDLFVVHHQEPVHLLRAVHCRAHDTQMRAGLPVGGKSDRPAEENKGGRRIWTA